VHAELQQNAGDVIPLGADGDVEPVGDPLTVEALRQSLENFCFSTRQAADGFASFVLLFSLAPCVADQVDDLGNRTLPLCNSKTCRATCLTRGCFLSSAASFLITA
jgi:hypothetical protein